MSYGAKPRRQTKKLDILLIEDNQNDVQAIQKMLIGGMGNTFNLECSERLENGLDHLAEGKVDVVLLDLSLSESQGVDTFYSVYSKTPHVPIIVITDVKEELSAIKAARLGAEDYLIKGKIDSTILAHSINFAVERKRMMKELERIRRREQEKLYAVSIVDELTGLYNKRGFIILFSQQKKLAHRNMKGIMLLFIDVDNMKRINDDLGRHEGDKILVKVAEIIKGTFRNSDISARIEGDKFALLAIDARNGCVEILINRLQENVKLYNVRADQRHRLSLSVGSAYYDPEKATTCDMLLIRAERSMYETKKSSRHRSEFKELRE